MDDIRTSLRAFADKAHGAHAELGVLLERLQRTLQDALDSAPSEETDALFGAAEAALDRTPPELVMPARIECSLAVVQHSYLVGRSIDALPRSSAAVEMARRLGDRRLLRKALTYDAILRTDSGHYAAGLEGHAQALALARELNDAMGEAATWVNVGGALFYLAQYRDSIRCSERALALIEERGLDDRLLPCLLHNMALCYLHLGDLRRGLDAIKREHAALPAPKTALDFHYRALGEAMYARLLLEVDLHEEARLRCELSQRYAELSRSPRDRLTASLVTGLYDVYRGRVEAGLSRLERVLNESRCLPATYRDALLALVKANELAGRPGVALEYLRQMMRHADELYRAVELREQRLYILRAPEGEAADVLPGESAFVRREKRLRWQLAAQVEHQEQARAQLDMLERMAVAAELRDDPSGEHPYRVGRLASLLASEFGCDAQTCQQIEFAARLHDIGKIGISDAILLKPGRLTDAERDILRSHVSAGVAMLAGSEDKILEVARGVVAFHHAWWNGSGYPDGVGGSSIPLAARVTALADVFDAMTHRRPYKEAWPVARALEEIGRLRGRQFDPELTDLFLALIQKLQRCFGDLDEYLGAGARAARQSGFLTALDYVRGRLSYDALASRRGYAEAGVSGRG